MKHSDKLKKKKFIIHLALSKSENQHLNNAGIPETWHDFPDGIKQGVRTEGSLAALPKGTKGFPELLH